MQFLEFTGAGLQLSMARPYEARARGLLALIHLCVLVLDPELLSKKIPCSPSS
jgi:hypothetical protein